MYEMCVTVNFSAAHHLAALPSDHMCSRPHGHTYTVTACIQSDAVDVAIGWTIDAGAVKEVMTQLIVDPLDHRDLNEELPTHPTAELLGRWCHERMAQWVPSPHRLAWTEVCEGYSTTFRYYADPAR